MNEEHTVYNKASQLLPLYLVGLVWLLALIAVIAVVTTPSAAREAVSQFAGIFSSVQIPEVAAAFLAAIFGVLLPLAVAVIVSPLSSAVAVLILRRWHNRRKPACATEEQYAAASERLCRYLGTGPVQSGGAYLFYWYLLKERSPLKDALDARFREIYVKARTIIPVAVLAAVTTYLALRQTSLALPSAFAAFVATLLATAYDTSVTLKSCEEDAVLAFLLATDELRSREPSEPNEHKA